MTDRGHDRYWTSFLTVVALVAGILLTVAALQLRRLRRLSGLMRSSRHVVVPDLGIARLLQAFGPLWLRVAIIDVFGYFVQENAEVGALGQPLPLLGVFAGEQWVALPMLILASALVAIVGALFRWRREILLRKLRNSWSFRRAAEVQRPARVDRPQSVVFARRNGGRAPPGALIAPPGALIAPA